MLSPFRFVRLVAPLCLLFAISLTGCSGGTSTTGGNSDEQVFAQGKEAKVWLANPQNTLLKIGTESGQQWAERLYQSGADSVKVCNVSRVAEGASGETSSTLAVGLPAKPEERKKLWPVLNELEVSFDHTKSTDTGQKFLVYNAK